VPLFSRAPDHSTLKKTAKRCGKEAVEQLNEALLEKAANNKVLKANRLRADTTVVPADVGYPTDSGLMARGVVRLGALVGKLHGHGLATRTKLRDRSRSMRRRAHDIGAWLRRRTDTAKEEAKAITSEMADIAEASLAEARAVARNARRGLRCAGDQGPGKARATLAELETLVSRLEQVVAQARKRLSGEMPEGSSRLVSLQGPDARPIKKGRIGKPVEFGYLGQGVDNEDGVVVDHSLHMGNPFDGPLLAPAIGRVKRLVGRPPRAVTADRGDGDARVDKDLTALGVAFVAIIRKGRQSAARRDLERSPRFRKLVKWRTGSEGRISALKRSWGWSKTLMDGLDGAKVWCGYGIFANNSQKISGLVSAKRQPGPPGERPQALRSRPPGTAKPPPVPLAA
jgi:IS5 family transposase